MSALILRTSSARHKLALIKQICLSVTPKYLQPQPTAVTLFPYQNQNFRMFSTDTTKPTNPNKKPISEYLIERLGFSKELSLATSKKYTTEKNKKTNKGNDLVSSENADSVINFLHGYCGLDQTQIKKAISKYPIVLRAKVDKTLKPKILLYKELGFTKSNLPLVISAHPAFYLELDLNPAIQVLRDLLGNDKDVIKVFRKIKWGGAGPITKNLIANIAYLESEYGVPREKLMRYVCHVPLAFVRKLDTVQKVLNRVEKWGIRRETGMFLMAFVVFSRYKDETIDSKCRVYRSFGWSESEILSSVRNYPSCVAYSEVRIKKMLEFYMNELGYEPAYIAPRISMFSYSFENRVVPRHRVVTILKEKGLIKGSFQPESFIRLTECDFVNKFILPHVNVLPKLPQVYIDGGAPSQMLLRIETSENDSRTLVAAE